MKLTNVKLVLMIAVITQTVSIPRDHLLVDVSEDTVVTEFDAMTLMNVLMDNTHATQMPSVLIQMAHLHASVIKDSLEMEYLAKTSTNAKAAITVLLLLPAEILLVDLAVNASMVLLDQAKYV